MNYECPGCYRQENRYVGEVASTKVFICCACGLAFTDPQPAGEYDHGEWYDWLEFTPEVGDKYLHYQTGMFERQLECLSKVALGKRLLEIGAGIGIFAKVASDFGWQVTCTEINPRARRFGADIYGLRFSDLESVKQESHDIVRLSHVLEHVSQPRTFLATIRERLRPDGVCLVIVPHYEPLNCVIKNLILRFVPGKHDFRGHIYAPQHVLGFTPSSLRTLFCLAGFAPVVVHSVSRGNKTYYPWISDDVRLSTKEIFFELINNVGNLLGRGSWIVGYFRNGGVGKDDQPDSIAIRSVLGGERVPLRRVDSHLGARKYGQESGFIRTVS